MKTKVLYLMAVAFLFTVLGFQPAFAWTPIPVKEDPLVRMPGTQPEQGVNLEGPGRCLNCHADYGAMGTPGHWRGSMMAQAARDPIWFACMTVAAQDAIWAVGTPNAVDICLRCHTPNGWLGGRSDPTNSSALTRTDFDGLTCDFCHRKWDPFFETTYDGTRESNDWLNYWDETNASATPSQPAADTTYIEDAALAQGILLFSGGQFFTELNVPRYAATFTENASGQYFVSTNTDKRASFADTDARHRVLYSRYHKSKYFCATCHDVSNPVLANLGLSGLLNQDPNEIDLITEQYSAAKYFHVERTFSEFMLSAYSQPGGIPTNLEFQQAGGPAVAGKCQDCHLPDVVAAGCDKQGALIRPTESIEHPNSGMPFHDMTGGNSWISYILGSLDPNTADYDPRNVEILDQGTDILTLDLKAGESPFDNGPHLLYGALRAKDQLRLAARIKNVLYIPSSGQLDFTIVNNTGHKLISGFPEGRRMFLNIQAFDAAAPEPNVIYEVNPYDYTVGTIKGLPHSLSSPALGPNEVYLDELVYDVHPSSSADVSNTNGLGLTGEAETFHFVLATGRYKDNRIPPKGFDIANAAARHSEPVWHGDSAPGYFTAAEYAGGYDDQSVPVIANANKVVITLYYQGTSREYIEFLRDEINGTQNLTLSDPNNPDPYNPDPAYYIVQTDPYFAQLKAWGNTIWDLWYHNHGLDGLGRQVEGIVPFPMTQVTIGNDVDGDGFTVAQGDCDDNNSLIYPGATEICGNTIDEDCNGIAEPCTAHTLAIHDVALTSLRVPSKVRNCSTSAKQVSAYVINNGVSTESVSVSMTVNARAAAQLESPIIVDPGATATAALQLAPSTLQAGTATICLQANIKNADPTADNELCKTMTVLNCQ